VFEAKYFFREKEGAMKKSDLVYFGAAALGFLLSVACGVPRDAFGASSAASDSVLRAAAGDSIRRPAAEFPEVQLSVKAPETLVGKIIGLDGDSLIFRLSPYWSSPVRRISVDDIDSLKLTQGKKKAASTGFVYCFGFSYIVLGSLCLINSKYDEDYRAGLMGTPLLSFGGGLIGLILGGLSDVGNQSEYDLAGMPHDKKIRTIHKIMGVHE
jgi:hypothetical protein